MEVRLFKTRHIVAILVAAAIVAVTGCSVQKNTANTRRWHAFKARYNTYYNGTLAYIDASEEKENGNKDNFTEIIPLYTVGNKASREIGKANYERAIEKSQKTIKLHSIKRRPQWTKKRRKTERDIEWLSRREYNPFLWRAWMLMGRSQFYKGSFDEAASTFSYMSRLYRTQPAIYGKARAWLAKSYIEEGWLYDAEDVIRGMSRDSIHWSARKEWDYTLADYYIHTGDYAKAVTYLRQVIRHEMRRKQRAREWFLMGQLQTALGNHAEAARAYRRVVRQNPPYEIEFNARIAMTEVMSASASQSKKVIGQLRRMARSDKNKDYLDQVYYALGNVYMARRDTAQALSAYESGVAKATRAGIEKGVLLLRLGDIYWTMERYSDAQRCYGEAIGLLDKERPDYEALSARSKVLDALVPYTDAVHLQDSLQSLAAMSEADRNAAIDRTIAELKRKEREERRRQEEQLAQNAQGDTGNGMDGNQNRNNNALKPTGQGAKQNATWYFYNPMAVSQGKATFQKLWGKRENADNWQRANKTVVNFGTDSGDGLEAAADSLAADSVAAGAEAVADSAAADPHKREYYLAQIPFTAEQKAESDRIIADGLYNSGVIFKDKLDNLALSEKQLVRLVGGYPSFDRMAEAYYHLYLLYMRKGDTHTADSYVERLKKEYPDNERTVLLSDPHYVENARFGVHAEDSLYAATYDAFKAARYAEVKGNVAVSDSRFPLGANRDKFMFIGGLSLLNEGDADGCLKSMRAVVEKFPQSPIATMAGMIVKGVGEGRRLKGGTFDLSSVWERRSAVLADGDSTAVRQLSPDRNLPFVYMVVYNPDSVDENRMLFELARYNFTSYLVRNFDISVEDIDGLHRMTVSGFRNYDEALQYARHLHAQKEVARRVVGGRAVVVSAENMALLGQQYSYDDYDKFYQQHFAPLKISADELLNEPDGIAPARQQDGGNGSDNSLDDNPVGGNSGGEVVPIDEPQQPVDNTGSEVVPVDTPPVSNTGSEVMPVDTPPVGNTGSEIVPVDTPPVNNTGSEIVPIDEPQDKPQPSRKVEPTATTAPQATAKPAAPSAPQTKQQPDDEFYFDDAPVATPQSNAPGKKDKATDADDDEYYELDGF